MLDSLKRIYEQETLSERMQRMVPAAAFGALVATAYVWTYSLINVFTFPGLPLGLDWVRLLSMWIGLAVALGLFGAIAAWFTEEYAGIIGGAVIFTILAGIFFLISSPNRFPAVQAVIMAFPLLGVCALGAWGLRWSAHRYLAIQHEAKPDQRKRMTKHILTLILIGLVPGILMRMDLPAEQTLTQFDELLRTAPTDPSVLPRLPLKQVPALKDHFGVGYKFYAHPSSQSAGSYDVTVRFADGFTMSCILPVGSGAMFITDCNEGGKVKTSP